MTKYWLSIFAATSAGGAGRRVNPRHRQWAFDQFHDKPRGADFDQQRYTSNQIRLAHRRADFQKPSRRHDTALVFNFAVYSELSTLRSETVIALKGITIFQMTQDTAVQQPKTGTDIATVVGRQRSRVHLESKGAKVIYGSRRPECRKVT